MNVPPLFPEPLTVPENAAEAQYDTRLTYIRRILRNQAGVWLGVVAVAVLAPPVPVPLPEAALAVLVLLALLHFTRRFGSAHRLDQRLGLVVFAAVLILLGLLGRELQALGWPVSVFPACAGLVWVYGVLAGRDFSFVGQYFLSLLALVSGLSAAVLLQALPLEGALLAGSLGVCFLAYLVYDLAMLLKRRRANEVALGVVDLFRDSLNFTTYGVRVWRHWQRERP